MKLPEVKYQYLPNDSSKEIIACYTDNTIEYFIPLLPTKELIHTTNHVRSTFDCRDVPKRTNQIMYWFYLYCCPKKSKIKLLAICEHSEKDDNMIYELPIRVHEYYRLSMHALKYLAQKIDKKSFPFFSK